MGRTTIGSIIGTTFDSKYWLALDPCGLLCIILSFGIHISAMMIIVLYILCRSQWIIQLIFSFFYIPSLVLALSSLIMVWTTNPGAVPMGARPFNIQPKKERRSTVSVSGEISTDEEDVQLSREKEVPSIHETGKQQQLQQSRGIRRCTKCNNNFKPPRAHHDSVTGRCIVKLDHFCPWVGNAIGVWNHKFFFLFIFYTCLSSLFTLLIFATKVLSCDNGGGDGDGDGDGDDDDDGNNQTSASWPFRTNSTRIIQQQQQLLPNKLSSSGASSDCDDLYSGPIFYLLIVSILFLFFTCCMLCEQMEPIRKNISKIAALKVKSGQASFQEYASVSNDFNELFGGDTKHCTWHWFFPLGVWFPDDDRRDMVLGYVYKDRFGDDPYDEDEEYEEEDSTTSSIPYFEDDGIVDNDDDFHNDVIQSSKKNILKNILTVTDETNTSSTAAAAPRYSRLLMETDEYDDDDDLDFEIPVHTFEEVSRDKTL